MDLFVVYTPSKARSRGYGGYIPQQGAEQGAEQGVWGMYPPAGAMGVYIPQYILL